MRILITNDDGIASPALPRLIRWAKQLGEVTAVAPKIEQSGMSQAIDFKRAVEIRQIELAPDVTVYSMDSTPADCVRFGVTGLHKAYDLVISGVNRGYNLGHDIAYSGTVGAILEAARLGIAGIALSCDMDTFDPAFEQLDTIWDYVMKNKLTDICGLYNINIPPNACGICVTRQGGEYYTDEFVCREDGLYVQVGEPFRYNAQSNDIDIVAVQNGYISITPLTAEKTDLRAFQKISH